MALLGLGMFGDFSLAQWLPNPPPNADDVGHAIAVAGEWAAVGAPGEDEGTGAVYLYRCVAARCSLVQRITSPDPDDKSSFGASLAMDADRLAVGSPDRDEGEVDVYRSQFGSWTFEARLRATDSDNHGRFGSALALDGSRLVIGAPRNGDSGSAYVFEREPGGWKERQKLLLPAGSERARFGSSVALDGDHLWIGGPLHDPDADGPAFARGAVATYQLAGNTWQFLALFTPSDASDGEQFGWRVGLANGLGVVSAPGANGRRGRLLVVEDVAAGLTVSEVFSATSAQSGDRFGWALDVRTDEILVGAAFAGAEPDARCGALMHYRFGAGQGWSVEEVQPPGLPATALLGWSVAFGAGSVFAGAPTREPAGGVRQIEQQFSVFAGGFEGVAAGCRPVP